jgi:proteasome lid subunit RPN8/RPN11
LFFSFKKKKVKNINESNKNGRKFQRKVILTKQVADGIITYSKTWHPNEGILILQGKSNKSGVISINGLVLPPFSSHGPYYSGFPTNELPLDLSYIGTVHSHPGNSNRPSLQDLNDFFGLISIIISFPYEYNTIGAYDRNGKNVDLIIDGV